MKCNTKKPNFRDHATNQIQGRTASNWGDDPKERENASCRSPSDGIICQFAWDEVCEKLNSRFQKEALVILPKKGRVPPSDGTSHWRLPVAPGVIIRAKGHQELIEAVFEYRLRNNIPVADIERDISAYYCGLYPNYCHAERADTDPTAMHVSSEPMLNRVSRWASVIAHRMPRGGYELVTKAEAESRATICAQCPKQDASWKGGCGGCNAATLQILQSLKKLKSTPKDGNLGACSIGGWANTTAVHLGVEALEISPEQKNALPDFCWRKKLP